MCISDDVMQEDNIVGQMDHERMDDHPLDIDGYYLEPIKNEEVAEEEEDVYQDDEEGQEEKTRIMKTRRQTLPLPKRTGMLA